jgi:mono/diheme cytochrome c family protein
VQTLFPLKGEWIVVGRDFKKGVIFGIPGGFLLCLAAVSAGVFFLSPAVLRHRTPFPLEVMVGQNRVRATVPKAYRRLRNPLTDSSAIISRAKSVYNGTCSLCHGGNGKGATDIGQNLFPTAADLTGPNATRMSDGSLYWIIGNGLSFVGMPAFGTLLSEKDLWGVVQYVRALQKAQAAPGGLPSPAPATGAAGSAASATDLSRGRQTYVQQGCNQCHGNRAEGGVGPPLVRTPLSFGSVLKRIRSGGGIMPAFGPDQLSENDARALYDWIESLSR